MIWQDIAKYNCREIYSLVVMFSRLKVKMSQWPISLSNRGKELLVRWDEHIVIAFLTIAVMRRRQSMVVIGDRLKKMICRLEKHIELPNLELRNFGLGRCQVCHEHPNIERLVG